MFIFFNAVSVILLVGIIDRIVYLVKCEKQEALKAKHRRMRVLDHSISPNTKYTWEIGAYSD